MDNFEAKAVLLLNQVTSDERWDVNDEILFNVFGLIYYGYCFGTGRLLWFMDADAINDFVVQKLTSLGAANKYVKGLVDYAFSTFQHPSNDLNAQLVEIGHSHFASKDFTKLIDAIFDNAKAIRSVS